MFPTRPVFLPKHPGVLFRRTNVLLRDCSFCRPLAFCTARLLAFHSSSLKRLLTAAGFCNIAVFARGNEVTVACYKLIALLLPLLLPQNKKPLQPLLFELPPSAIFALPAVSRGHRQSRCGAQAATVLPPRIYGDSGSGASRGGES